MAQQHRYRQEEGLACELYARFWLSQGDNQVAGTYLREAFYLYQLWRAHAKLELLRSRYPEFNLGGVFSKSTLIQQKGTIITTSSSSSHTSDLDLISIIKASRSLSEEIQLENLSKKLIGIVMENAGAQRGMLLLEKEGKWVIEAHNYASSQSQTLPLYPLEFHPSPILPIRLVQQVIQSTESIIINDAQTDRDYSQDNYIQSEYVKSILCSPVLNQGKLVAIIYLENNLSTGVFTPSRLELVRSYALTVM